MPSLTVCGLFKVEGGKVSLARGGADHGEGCADSPACAEIRNSMYLGGYHERARKVVEHC